MNHFLYFPFYHICTSARLFVHLERVSEELKVYLNASCVGSLCVQLKSYDSVRDNLKKYVAQPGVKVWIGTEYTNYALYELIAPKVCRYFISLYLLYYVISFFVSVILCFFYLGLNTYSIIICLCCCILS